MAQGFFQRSPWEHARMAFQAAPGMAWDSIRDATGIAYAEGAIHKLQQRAGKRQMSRVNPTPGSWYGQEITLDIEFHRLRAKGFTGAAALAEMNHLPMGAAAPRSYLPVTSRMTRSGHLAGSLAFAANAYYAFHHSFGPLYGGIVGTASGMAAMVGPRMGWGLGAAAGMAIGGPIGATVGAIIGGAVGLIAAPMAIDMASTAIPMLGFRLSRRGFGNMNGPYQDNPRVHSMRQAAVQAISQSHMNARNALGGEAALLHFS